MKIVYFILLLTIAACGSSCKNKPCSELKTRIDIASTGLAAALSCSNPEAVRRDVYQFVQDKQWCKKDQDLTGPIAMVICPIVVNAFVNFGLTKLPAEWGCTGTLAKQGLTSACNLLPW
jgi:hypothetical protein